MKAIEFTERLKKTIRQAGIPGDYRVNAYCELDDDQDVEEYEEAFSLYIGNDPYLQWRPYPEVKIALRALCRGITTVLDKRYHASVRPYLDTELEDDDTETGGTSFSGETVRDFIEETADDSDVGAIDLDILNDSLKECGIRPVA